jgi:hypothetical protein
VRLPFFCALRYVKSKKKVVYVCGVRYTYGHHSNKGIIKMIRMTTVAALLVAGAALTGCFGKEEAATETTEAVEPAAGTEAAAPAAAEAAAPAPAAADAAAPAADAAAPATETTY